MLDKLVQALSILVSILLAFAIDAWWEDSQERERYLDQLGAVQVEFAEAREQLDWHGERLLGNRVALAWILERTAPNPPQVEFEELASQIDQTFRGFSFEFQADALRGLMESGVIGHMQSTELMDLLGEWSTQVVETRNQTQMLLQNREEIIRYLQPRIPANAVAYNTGQMSAYPRTRFKGDSTALLGEMEFEGLMGNRGVLVEDAMSQMEDLEQLAQRIEALIEQEF